MQSLAQKLREESVGFLVGNEGMGYGDYYWDDTGTSIEIHSPHWGFYRDYKRDPLPHWDYIGTTVGIHSPPFPTEHQTGEEANSWADPLGGRPG